MGKIKDDLRGPGVQLVETHISWVFLAERDVWKVKKPVSLGFLDFSTPHKRRQACEAEVRLNRRLAPDVYRGVVPVTLDQAGHHRIGGAGQPVDWAVHIARLPDHHRADVRLARGTLGTTQLQQIAERLASFHSESQSTGSLSRYGALEAVAANIQENFDQTADCIHTHLNPGEAREIEVWQRTFLQSNADRFRARVAQGRVREGHGDLRLEHIYIDDSGDLNILDCIEFSERFRCADVCSDAAFLSMDLAWHGRVDLAEQFLAAYARAASDYDLYPLIDFYESYLAYVRGKVACILASDAGADRRTRQHAAREARRYFALALASKRRPLIPPALLAVGGVIAAGKTTLAEHVAAYVAAPVIDADRTRKWLLGLSPLSPVPEQPWAGAYSHEVTEQVYAELLRRAQAVLTSGRPVVLDASFRSRRHRAAARQLARDNHVPFYFVECRADPSLCRERLAVRDRQPGVSDGRLDLFEAFRAHWEPVTELPQAEHIVLDTSLPPDMHAEKLRRRVSAWPVGLTG
ncbi:MAG: hypothetical protein AMS18_07505 [Gemmatimonas sp. SG8_17]|nr:MAG: hypothetical protein AMS18_07505 [Gemmatimonas sp. SG8_17]